MQSKYTPTTNTKKGEDSQELLAMLNFILSDSYLQDSPEQLRACYLSIENQDTRFHQVRLTDQGSMKYAFAECGRENRLVNMKIMYDMYKGKVSTTIPTARKAYDAEKEKADTNVKYTWYLASKNDYNPQKPISKGELIGTTENLFQFFGDKRGVIEGMVHEFLDPKGEISFNHQRAYEKEVTVEVSSKKDTKQILQKQVTEFCLFFSEDWTKLVIFAVVRANPYAVLAATPYTFQMFFQKETPEEEDTRTEEYPPFFKFFKKHTYNMETAAFKKCFEGANKDSAHFAKFYFTEEYQQMGPPNTLTGKIIYGVKKSIENIIANRLYSPIQFIQCPITAECSTLFADATLEELKVQFKEKALQEEQRSRCIEKIKTNPFFVPDEQILPGPQEEEEEKEEAKKDHIDTPKFRKPTNLNLESDLEEDEDEAVLGKRPNASSSVKDLEDETNASPQ